MVLSIFPQTIKNRKEIEHMMLNMDFVIRLLVAGILGTIIGLDREYRAKEAGYRTHFLVSLGSALIMIVSQYGFQEIIKERIYWCRNHHLSKTDCTRIDYRRRNLGNSRYRLGGRCRNVHHRYCRHGVNPRRTGTT